MKLNSVDVAEAQVVLSGVRLAPEKGVQAVVVEMDSQVTFSALYRPKEDISYFSGIIGEIFALCRNFNS